jgi:hypothetical protein
MKVPHPKISRRFSAMLALGAISLALFVLTLLWHDWIEVFGVDPDHGTGLLEYGVAVALGLAALVLPVLAGVGWRRAGGERTEAGR